MVLTLSMNFFITAQGFTKISMLSISLGAICNIVAGSGLYLWSGYGDPGSGAGHGALTGAVDDLDPVFPVREKTGGADPAAADPAGMEDSDSLSGAGGCLPLSCRLRNARFPSALIILS